MKAIVFSNAYLGNFLWSGRRTEVDVGSFSPHLSPGAISARSAGQSAPRIPGTHYEDESVLQLEGPFGFCFANAGFFRLAPPDFAP